MNIDTLNLRLFDDAGTVTNATGNIVNAYTGETTARGTGNTQADNNMSFTMKEYYNTELLENARPKLVFSQLGKKQSLPRNHGTTVEWRKWNTFPKALTPLTEGVIPAGKPFGQTHIKAEINQYGDYTTITDRLDVHAVDDVILGATEEMGAAGGETADTLTRNVLVTGTNVIYADTVADDGTKTTPATRAQLAAEGARGALTPDMVNKAVTFLKKQKAPTFAGGKYVGVIHPSVAYDLRSSSEWVEAHKYAATTEIFSGEIGELHGVRFIETSEAPILASGVDGCVVYASLFFGKDAFAVVDPEGMGMEMIIHDRSEVGGPLNQFSTVGYKFETGAAILYQERMVRVEACGAYCTVDSVN